MEETRQKIKKIAVLNDMAGYGRCALTAAIPVISALRVQCCPVVTAVLSNHAGYPSCFLMIIQIGWNPILPHGRSRGLRWMVL